MKKMNKLGFTIVELVIVIALIAILAAVLIPTFASLVQKANESTDIQAVRNINVFLASADILNEIDSILDVYEIMEESGYSVESYSPLYSGRSFYYDKQDKCIIYVEDSTGKILFPSEYEGNTQGTHDWYSLSMELAPKPVTPVTSGTTSTYTVSTPNEYIYIVETLNNSWPAGIETLEIKLSADLDFCGAYATIASIPNGVTFIFNGGNHTVKNLTSNAVEDIGGAKEGQEHRQYTASALIGSVGKSNVVIKDTVFDNLNVKNTNCGNVALLIASAVGSGGTGTVEINNVDINNSVVVGHRSVGAIVGMLYSNVKLVDTNLNNVEVCTVGGRSGLLFGFTSMVGSIDYSGYSATNSSLSIYECEQNAVGITDFTGNGNATKNIHSYSTEADGSKEEKDYGFNEKALYCLQNNYWTFELASN